MSEIKWYKNTNNVHTLRMAAVQFGVANPTKFSTDELVDLLNQKLAKKKGAEVPAEIVLVKKQPKPAQPAAQKAKLETTPKVPRQTSERKPREKKEAAPIQEVPAGTIVLINGRPMKDGKLILANRKMLLTGIKGDQLLGQLLHERTNEVQKSVITMPIEFTDYKPVQEVAAAQ